LKIYWCQIEKVEDQIAKFERL